MNPLDDDTSTRTGLWVVFSTVTLDPSPTTSTAELNP